jgi:hypothetical protein
MPLDRIDLDDLPKTTLRQGHLSPCAVDKLPDFFFRHGCPAIHFEGECPRRLRWRQYITCPKRAPPPHLTSPPFRGRGTAVWSAILKSERMYSLAPLGGGEGGGEGAFVASRIPIGCAPQNKPNYSPFNPASHSASLKPTRCTPTAVSRAKGRFTRLPLAASMARASSVLMPGSLSFRPRAR